MIAFYFPLTPITKAERVAIFKIPFGYMSCQLRRLCKRNLNLLDLGSRLFRVYIFPIGTRGDTCEILSDVGGKPELLWVFLLYLLQMARNTAGTAGISLSLTRVAPPPLPVWGEEVNIHINRSKDLSPFPNGTAYTATFPQKAARLALKEALNT